MYGATPPHWKLRDNLNHDADNSDGNSYPVNRDKIDAGQNILKDVVHEYSKFNDVKIDTKWKRIGDVARKNIVTNEDRFSRLKIVHEASTKSLKTLSFLEPELDITFHSLKSPEYAHFGEKYFQSVKNQFDQNQQYPRLYSSPEKEDCATKCKNCEHNSHYISQLEQRIAFLEAQHKGATFDSISDVLSYLSRTFYLKIKISGNGISKKGDITMDIESRIPTVAIPETRPQQRALSRLVPNFNSLNSNGNGRNGTKKDSDETLPLAVHPHCLKVNSGSNENVFLIFRFQDIITPGIAPAELQEILSEIPNQPVSFRKDAQKNWIEPPFEELSKNNNAEGNNNSHTQFSDFSNPIQGQIRDANLYGQTVANALSALPSSTGATHAPVVLTSNLGVVRGAAVRADQASWPPVLPPLKFSNNNGNNATDGKHYVSTSPDGFSSGFIAKDASKSLKSSPSTLSMTSNLPSHQIGTPSQFRPKSSYDNNKAYFSSSINSPHTSPNFNMAEMIEKSSNSVISKTNFLSKNAFTNNFSLLNPNKRGEVNGTGVLSLSPALSAKLQVFESTMVERLVSFLLMSENQLNTKRNYLKQFTENNHNGEISPLNDDLTCEDSDDDIETKLHKQMLRKFHEDNRFYQDSINANRDGIFDFIATDAVFRDPQASSVSPDKMDAIRVLNTNSRCGITSGDINSQARNSSKHSFGISNSRAAASEFSFLNANELFLLSLASLNPATLSNTRSMEAAKKREQAYHQKQKAEELRRARMTPDSIQRSSLNSPNQFSDKYMSERATPNYKPKKASLILRSVNQQSNKVLQFQQQQQEGKVSFNESSPAAAKKNEQRSISAASTARPSIQPRRELPIAPVASPVDNLSEMKQRFGFSTDTDKFSSSLVQDADTAAEIARLRLACGRHAVAISAADIEKNQHAFRVRSTSLDTDIGGLSHTIKDGEFASDENQQHHEEGTRGLVLRDEQKASQALEVRSNLARLESIAIQKISNQSNSNVQNIHNEFEVDGHDSKKRLSNRSSFDEMVFGRSQGSLLSSNLRVPALWAKKSRFASLIQPSNSVMRAFLTSSSTNELVKVRSSSRGVDAVVALLDRVNNSVSASFEDRGLLEAESDGFKDLLSLSHDLKLEDLHSSRYGPQRFEDHVRSFMKGIRASLGSLPGLGLGRVADVVEVGLKGLLLAMDAEIFAHQRYISDLETVIEEWKGTSWSVAILRSKIQKQKLINETLRSALIDDAGAAAQREKDLREQVNALRSSLVKFQPTSTATKGVAVLVGEIDELMANMEEETASQVKLLDTLRTVAVSMSKETQSSLLLRRNDRERIIELPNGEIIRRGLLVKDASDQVNESDLVKRIVLGDPMSLSTVSRSILNRFSAIGIANSRMEVNTRLKSIWKNQLLTVERASMFIFELLSVMAINPNMPLTQASTASILSMSNNTSNSDESFAASANSKNKKKLPSASPTTKSSGIGSVPSSPQYFDLISFGSILPNLSISEPRISLQSPPDCSLLNGFENMTMNIFNSLCSSAFVSKINASSQILSSGGNLIESLKNSLGEHNLSASILANTFATMFNLDSSAYSSNLPSSDSNDELSGAKILFGILSVSFKALRQRPANGDTTTSKDPSPSPLLELKPPDSLINQLHSLLPHVSDISALPSQFSSLRGLHPETSFILDELARFDSFESLPPATRLFCRAHGSIVPLRRRILPVRSLVQALSATRLLGNALGCVNELKMTLVSGASCESLASKGAWVNPASLAAESVDSPTDGIANYLRMISVRTAMEKMGFSRTDADSFRSLFSVKDMVINPFDQSTNGSNQFTSLCGSMGAELPFEVALHILDVCLGAVNQQVRHRAVQRLADVLIPSSKNLKLSLKSKERKNIIGNVLDLLEQMTNPNFIGVLREVLSHKSKEFEQIANYGISNVNYKSKEEVVSSVFDALSKCLMSGSACRLSMLAMSCLGIHLCPQFSMGSNVSNVTNDGFVHGINFEGNSGGISNNNSSLSIASKYKTCDKSLISGLELSSQTKSTLTKIAFSVAQSVHPLGLSSSSEPIRKTISYKSFRGALMNIIPIELIGDDGSFKGCMLALFGATNEEYEFDVKLKNQKDEIEKAKRISSGNAFVHDSNSEGIDDNLDNADPLNENDDEDSSLISVDESFDFEDDNEHAFTFLRTSASEGVSQAIKKISASNSNQKTFTGDSTVSFKQSQVSKGNSNNLSGVLPFISLSKISHLIVALLTFTGASEKSPSSANQSESLFHHSGSLMTVDSISLVEILADAFTDSATNSQLLQSKPILTNNVADVRESISNTANDGNVTKSSPRRQTLSTPGRVSHGGKTLPTLSDIAIRQGVGFETLPSIIEVAKSWFQLEIQNTNSTNSKKSSGHLGFDVDPSIEITRDAVERLVNLLYSTYNKSIYSNTNNGHTANPANSQHLRIPSVEGMQQENLNLPLGYPAGAFPETVSAILTTLESLASGISFNLKNISTEGNNAMSSVRGVINVNDKSLYGAAINTRNATSLDKRKTNEGIQVEESENNKNNDSLEAIATNIEFDNNATANVTSNTLSIDDNDDLAFGGDSVKPTVVSKKSSCCIVSWAAVQTAIAFHAPILPITTLDLTFLSRKGYLSHEAAAGAIKLPYWLEEMICSNHCCCSACHSLTSIENGKDIVNCFCGNKKQIVDLNDERIPYNGVDKYGSCIRYLSSNSLRFSIVGDLPNTTKKASNTPSIRNLMILGFSIPDQIGTFITNGIDQNKIRIGALDFCHIGLWRETLQHLLDNGGGAKKSLKGLKK